MKGFTSSIILLSALGASLLLTGCSSQKETVTSVGMQNLTARYNVIYNAKLLIGQSQTKIENAWVDDYEQLLSVYKEPTAQSSQAEIKILDSAITKTDFIVSDKSKSNYVGEAYLLKARANYLKSSYFNASEYYNYVYITYPKDKELTQAALVGKARSLLQLTNYSEASRVLDTAFKYIKSEKKSPADIYASIADLYIRSGHQSEAIPMLQQALKFEKRRALRIRWTYLLAQLQEDHNELQPAFENYTRILKSIAPFEMAFNANLNRIRIEMKQSGETENQIARLTSLLKDNKSKEFTDQIHYRIAQLYQQRGNEEEAIKSYNKAVRSSIKNQNQKGLAYEKIAEIYFKNGDYAMAKTYYDSTLTALSPTYSRYEAIRLKSGNLDLLADRFKTIAREDTLQMLARLPKEELDQKLDAIFREQMQRSVSSSAMMLSPGGDTRFYFNNTAAMAQGLLVFKQRWGGRKLEDNWRRSAKSAAFIAQPLSNATLPTNPVPTVTAGLDSVAIRKSYVDNLPISAEQLLQSNRRVIEANIDIANFYKDVLKDVPEAIGTYENILRRFPDTDMKPVIYYNLYRLYAATHPSESTRYKDLLLKDYSQTAYAQVIIDPDYMRKADEKLSALTTAYNTVYSNYTSKDYAGVMAGARASEAQFGTNSFSSQIAYLNALAIGRTQNVDTLEAALQKIEKDYPDDKIITPLVKQNLGYIKLNREALAKRPFAIIDFDPNEPVFVEEPAPQPAPAPASTVVKAQPTAPLTPNITKKENPVTAPPAAVTPAPATPAVTTPASTPPPAAAPSIFSLPPVAEYYYVFNVFSGRLNLSSSRFGIGQFNRSNYAGSKISHQLKDVNKENQLIFVGPFATRDDVERYQSRVSPLLRDIMKIAATEYNTFIITKDGLDKLTSRDLINGYVEFYSANK